MIYTFVLLGAIFPFALLVFLIWFWKKTRFACLPWIVAWLVESAVAGELTGFILKGGFDSSDVVRILMTWVPVIVVLIHRMAEALAIAMLAANVSVFMESNDHLVRKLAALGQHQKTMGVSLLILGILPALLITLVKFM